MRRVKTVRFEYRVVLRAFKPGGYGRVRDHQADEAALNAAGGQGWKVVSVEDESFLLMRLSEGLWG